MTGPVGIIAELFASEGAADYLGRLSPVSVYTLGVQGGPMYGDELDSFEANPFRRRRRGG